MVGIVLITHGNLATEMMQVCRGIAGECNAVSIITFSANESRQQLCEKVEKTIRSAERGDGVLVLVDIFGGSTANICLGMYGKNIPIEVICGVNLSMLLEAIYNCDKYSLSELAKRVVEKGKEGVVNATELCRIKLKEQKQS
ncbi:MAG: PTS sugar transporter subunit IIA [bacterium]|nr:PTS sugar transporter subunit IIA [bacterium]